jgi:hypothetical protein
MIFAEKSVAEKLFAEMSLAEMRFAKKKRWWC